MKINNSKLGLVYLIGFFLILALPLLNLPPWFSPPDWGKTVVFRIILSSLIFIFIYQTVLSPGSMFLTTVKNTLSGMKRNLAFWLLFALFLIFLLSTIFSLDSHFSLWGSPYRSGGFLNFAFYIIFAVLVLLIIRHEDWQKIWDFSFLIGIFVSIVAIFQQFGLLKEFFVTFETRPPSTIGGPIFLAIYLLLLSFLTLVFGLKERGKKRLFYFFSFLLFLYVIFLTLSRAALMGLVIGILYFLFFYPHRIHSKGIKGLPWLKIFTGIILALGIYGYFYYVTTYPKVLYLTQENKILSPIISRIPLITSFKEISRVSAWEVSWSALKAKPVLGYGPENFSVGFDKYYDPSLPGIEKMPGGMITTWWDRAHNFVFDIALTAGIPALIIYLSLFGVLFWQLQRLKSAEKNADNNAEITPNNKIIYHGLQTTFIAYLVANFFSFDTFSSYLISFLLIAFSLHLISGGHSKEEPSKPKGSMLYKKQAIACFLYRRRLLIVFVLFLLLIWFIWNYNIKLFQLNTQINIARYLVENHKCQQAIERMENILPKKSFLDAYLRLRYVDFMRKCEAEAPEISLEFAQKGYEILKENIKVQPYNTRSWLLLGNFANVLIERKNDLIKKGVNPEVAESLKKEVQDLKNEANFYLEKAYQLSPKRQEVFIEWTKHEIVAQDYQKAIDKAQQCIDLNPELADCYWFKGLAGVFSGNLKEGKENIKIAEDKGYPVNTFIPLWQLAKAHSLAKNYEELVPVYQGLIQTNPKEPQYHATLAFVYRELGEFENARQEALKILELQPESRKEVEAFLRTLE